MIAMKYDPVRHHRRSIRLPGHDYSQPGAYFVTLCAYHRECCFGEIVNGVMRLNPAGEIVAEEWLKTAQIRAEISLDEWIVMPNHWHGIVVIDPRRGDRPVAPTPSVAPTRATTIAHNHRLATAPRGPQARSIAAVMAGFKSAVTKRINEWHRSPGAKLWQRNYWERVVRDQTELNHLRDYIRNNPAQWDQDSLHPDQPITPAQGDRGFNAISTP